MGSREVSILVLLNLSLSDQCEATSRSRQILKNHFWDEHATRILCKIMKSSDNSVEIRVRAAEILADRLRYIDYWEALNLPQKTEILLYLREALLSLMEENVERLRRPVVLNVKIAIAQMQERNDDWIASVFCIIQTMCVSQQESHRELGAYIFSQMAEIAFYPFNKYVSRAETIFIDCLEKADSEARLVSLTNDFLIAGWMRTLIERRNEVEVGIGIYTLFIGMQIKLTEIHLKNGEVLDNFMPTILRIIHSWPYKSTARYTFNGIKLLDNLMKHSPGIVSRELNRLIRIVVSLFECERLEIRQSKKALDILKRLVIGNVEKIIDLELMDRILGFFCTVLSVTPNRDSNNRDDFLDTCRAENTIVGSAVDMLKMLVSEMKENFCLYLSTYIYKMFSAIKARPPANYCAGIFIFFAALAKDPNVPWDIINTWEVLELVELGLYSKDQMVRQAAQFSLATIVERLQPDIIKYFNYIMYMFYISFYDILNSLNVETPIFDSLIVLLRNMRSAVLKGHVPDLMDYSLRFLKSDYSSITVKQKALSVIAILGDLVTDSLDPYFDQIVDIASSCLLFNNGSDHRLRTQAFRVFATLRRVSMEKFSAYTVDLLDKSVRVMQKEIVVSMFIYDLLGQLCAASPDDFKMYFNIIIEYVFEELKNDYENESSVEEFAYFKCSLHKERYQIPNRRSKALNCLKSMIVNQQELIVPYIEEAIKVSFDCITRRNDYDVQAGLSTISKIILHQWRLDKVKARSLCSKYLPKLTRRMLDTNSPGHVIECLGYCRSLLKKLKRQCCHCYDGLFTVIHLALNRKLPCQSEKELNCYKHRLPRDWRKPPCWCNHIEKEYVLLKMAKKMLSLFGEVVGPKIFIAHVQTINGRFLWRPRKNRNMDKKFFICEALIGCLESLDYKACRYYQAISKFITQGIIDPKKKIRNRSFDLLIKIMQFLYRNPNVNSLHLSSSLINAIGNPGGLTEKQKQEGCLLGCHMILKDNEMFPINDFLDVLFDHLPLTKIRNAHFANKTVAKALQKLLDDDIVPDRISRI
ncbi:uncharacterized protein LOC108103331 [Drosophila eugracilis]|uniref:uncharacterized protein LOC108103331 n=1 Tax=Drosophila eugracilis TaxID=29029 RepID=UPI0007E729A9|nr:uncharacterized protein LOC108103331 [Drosophila eugracilis]